MKELLERWLAARDHVAIRSAWQALPTVLQTVGTPYRKLTLHGAAQLAGAMLGERADWLIARSNGAPVYTVNRISGGATLDHVWNITEENQEGLVIHEQRDGLRGVQLILLSSGTVTGRPEGGSVTAVRIFDRDRAAVVPIDVYVFTEVATIGSIDLAPLDLLEVARHFPLPGDHDVATARALVAQIVAEIDAHFDVSTQWAEGTPATPADWYWTGIASHQSFVDGERAVSIGHERAGGITAYVHGLPWGQRCVIYFEAGREPYVVMRFPTAELDRIEARLTTLGKR